MAFASSTFTPFSSTVWAKEPHRSFTDFLFRHLLYSNRSQVQGSTFRVKDKEGIEGPKSSLKTLIFPNNCQLGPKFWIRPDEAYVFLVNTHPKCSPETKMEP